MGSNLMDRNQLPRPASHQRHHSRQRPRTSPTPPFKRRSDPLEPQPAIGHRGSMRLRRQRSPRPGRLHLAISAPPPHGSQLGQTTRPQPQRPAPLAKYRLRPLVAHHRRRPVPRHRPRCPLVAHQTTTPRSPHPARPLRLPIDSKIRCSLLRRPFLLGSLPPG
ncbi:MAG: hypothetical protein RLZZ179_1157 [Verrucomicrobiota bacterium]|jgi:hypothetical protein